MNEATTLLDGATPGTPSNAPQPTIAQSREAAGRVLYGNPEVMHRENGNLMRDAVLERLGTREEATAASADLVATLGKYTDTSTDGRALADVFAQALRKEPTAEQSAAWKERAMLDLRIEYGENAGQVLAKTKAMVLADPVLKKRLAGAIANHPAVVRVLAKKAVRS